MGRDTDRGNNPRDDERGSEALPPRKPAPAPKPEPTAVKVDEPKK